MPGNRPKLGNPWVALLLGLMLLVFWVVDPGLHRGTGTFEKVTGAGALIGGLGLIVVSLIGLVTKKS